MPGMGLPVPSYRCGQSGHIGYALCKTLEAEGPLKALRMAMDFYNRYNVDLNNLIHHSDRGVQYCSNLYVGMLKKHHINISMTQCGDPLHNALAERMNNTIKNGWLFDCTDDSFEQLDKRIADAIYAYNYVRPHQGIQMRTPMEYIRKCSGKVA
ncbi:integrase core domain-containing protein, partial [Bacteroides ovatus]|nr:integrase core domain-containing protein [Bacteroides ovatus]